VQWQHGYDVLTRTRFADVDHGSTYTAPDGARCTEHYVGHVEVDTRTGEQVATGMARYTLDRPPAAVRSTAWLLLRLTADALSVDVDLDVEEGDGIADGSAGGIGTLVARRQWRAAVSRSPWGSSNG
jgi:hypothetical protein